MINQRSISTNTRPRSLSRQPEGDPFSIFDRSVEVKRLKRRFWWFSVIASLNHALNYVVTAFATSLLSQDLGGTILGLSWCLNAVSGLTVATPIVRRFGFKYAMILSLLGYAIQIGSLYWAVITPRIIEAWIVAVSGSVVAGFTSAVWWTSQGVYFDDICVSIDRVLAADNEDTKSTMVDAVRSEMAAHWTLIYQSADIVVFLSLSLFPTFTSVSINQVLLALFFMGFITTLLGFTFEEPSPEDSGQAKELSSTELWEAVAAVPKQFVFDARVGLLSPFVFGFGITTAMFAFYVNDDAVSDNLGTVTLGFLEAFSYFVAVVAAYPYAFVSSYLTRGQDWVIQFGSLAFLSCGLIVLGTSSQKLGTWQNILVAKGMYGLGRGVFEGSCRAVYAAMFTGNDLSTAFSGQTLAAGFSGGVCFFLFGILDRKAIGAITVVNGIMAVVSYFVLMYCIDARTPIGWGPTITAILTCGLKGGGKNASAKTTGRTSSGEDDFTPLSFSGIKGLEEPLVGAYESSSNR